MVQIDWEAVFVEKSILRRKGDAEEIQSFQNHISISSYHSLTKLDENLNDMHENLLLKL